MFEARTTIPSALERMLNALESFGSFAPTHWGPLERKRFDWSRADVSAYVAKEKTEWGVLDDRIELWRTKAPKFTGHASTSDAEINEIQLELSPAPEGAKLRELFDATAQVVDRLPTAFAYVSPSWKLDSPIESMTPDEVRDLNTGGWISAKQLKTCGPTSIAARTWFGPLLRERLGEPLLRRLGATDTSGGDTLLLDLIPEPWRDVPQELARAKTTAVKALRKTKMMATRRTGDDPIPGPAWTRPPWRSAREVVDAERKS